MKRLMRRISRLFARAPLTYSPPYASWDEACRDAGTYANPALLDEERAAARAVKEGRAAFVLFGLPQKTLTFRWPLLSSLVAIAGWHGAFAGRPLRILDFGGGLGGVYVQHRRFLDTLPALSWSVVEQPHFVRAGQAEFADERLGFFDTIAEANLRAPIDAALCVGSLDYLTDPYAILAELIARNVPTIVLIATQMTRFLSRSKLLALFAGQGYETVADLGTGYLFRKKAPP